MTTYSTLNSPVGELLLVGTDAALAGIYLPDHLRGRVIGTDWTRDDAALATTRDQLRAYFDGSRQVFDLPLDQSIGTPFQQRVWEALRDIPYGETTTYASLAEWIGRPGSARAVGHANARNPYSIVVPCHRVVGSSGALTGYAGGVPTKRWLLAHEAR